MEDKSKDLYFLTTDNLSEFLKYENKEISDNELLERVKLNFSLFKSNKNMEKKKMLLNNCLLTFKLFGGEIPPDLLFLVYFELFKLQSKDELENIKKLFNDLYDKFNLFSNENKIKYSNKLLEIIDLIINFSYEHKNKKLVEELIDISIQIYSDYNLNTNLNLNYAKIITVYANLLLEDGMVLESIKVLKNAYALMNVLPDFNTEKEKNLASICFLIGNILLELKSLTNARDYFIETIKLSMKNEPDFKILNMSFNYLSEVYLYLNDYDKAIDVLSKFLDLTKDYEKSDDFYYIRSGFYYEIGFIYDKFKNCHENAMQFMHQAKEEIDKISNKNEDALEVLSKINEYLMNV